MGIEDDFGEALKRADEALDAIGIGPKKARGILPLVKKIASKIDAVLPFIKRIGAKCGEAVASAVFTGGGTLIAFIEAAGKCYGEAKS
jgi:hypothetical protein